MRRRLIVFLFALCVASGFSTLAANGRVAKVLPQFLDRQGRHALSPSLFDRDAYQDQLRKNPEQRSALRFDVLWRVRGTGTEKLRLRVELRGVARGNLPSQKSLEQSLNPAAFSRWTSVTFGGEEYRQFGEVTAWRVTLWADDQLLGEQKSFLW
jgi:hypothetical protein